MKLLSRLWMWPGIMCGMGVLLMTTPGFAQTLRAVPQTVTLPAAQTSGKATITWDAGAANSDAEVWLKIGNDDEELFSSEAKGTRDVIVEAGKTYTFKLYKDEVVQDVLATVVVVGKRAVDGAVGAPAGGDDAAPEAAPIGKPSFTGTWNTLADGGQDVTVILKQVGNTVEGRYSPNSGKIFDGIVTGNKLAFKWTQNNGGREGVGEFTLNPDGKGFTGSATALKPEVLTVTWNSYIPDPLFLAGVWETTSNNAPFTLTLQQEGDKITGTYTPGNGKMEGTLKDKVLRFTWSSDDGEGSGRFIFDKSEMAFSGTYSNSDDPDEVDGIWNGTRKMGGGGGKGPPVSYAGTWSSVIKIGNGTMTMIYEFQQTGNKVTGYYYLSPDQKNRIEIKDATVSGNTLNFMTFMNGKPYETGRFQMAADGKSFKGNVGQASGSANLVSR